MPVLITEVRMLALVSPVLGVVTSKYNPERIHPISKRKLPHLGTDFVAPIGTPIRALADGVVVATVKRSVGDVSVNGILPDRTGSGVLVDHGPGLRTYYGHTAPAVKVGRRVSAGEVVGHSDGSGNITGPHLHHELHVNGIAIDVEPWAEQRGLDIGITDTNQEDDVALTPEEKNNIAAIPDLVTKVNDLVASKDKVVQPALSRIDIRTAKLLADGLPVDKIVAGVLAGIPQGGGAVDPKVIADAVRAELAESLAS